MQVLLADQTPRAWSLIASGAVSTTLEPHAVKESSPPSGGSEKNLGQGPGLIRKRALD